MTPILPPFLREPLKRGIDFALSGTLLLMFSPLLAGVAVWVKLDSRGPVFHRSQRVGRGNKPFWMYKFRSMLVDPNGHSSTKRDDPRITRSGRFIRKYKIDELSQLINVFTGDMSLVGPRPEILKYAPTFNGDLAEILSVRPGITDWASIWNSDQDAVLAGANDPARAYEILVRPTKLMLQLRYVRDRSLRTDVRIILYTLRRIVDPSFYPRELADIPKLSPGAAAALVEEDFVELTEAMAT